MREAVLSLRVVTADGREIRTARRARKSAAGYDLTRLFVGAEGTLGIITEVTLRLHPIPEVISSAVCSFETIEGAATTVIQAIQLGVPLARAELLDDVQMRAVNPLVEARLSREDHPILRIPWVAGLGRRAGLARRRARQRQWRGRVRLVVAS